MIYKQLYVVLEAATSPSRRLAEHISHYHRYPCYFIDVVSMLFVSVSVRIYLFICTICGR